MDSDRVSRMERCCNSDCPFEMFHWECVTPPLTEAPPNLTDWYCSDDCAESRGYIYCVCHEKRGGRMVQCRKKAKCKRHQWYHLKCLGLSNDDLPEKWYCCDECSKGGEEDMLLTHNLHLLWNGLMLQALRDMLREGDGDALLSMWRIHMIQFWNDGHTHYKTIAQQFLAFVGGVVPERLQHELTWEQVVNMSGRPGGNIGMDLCNEFLNNEFKEMIKNCKGQYTEKQIERCCRMIGSFGKNIEQLFMSSLQDDLFQDAYREKFVDARYKEDLVRFVNLFARDKLFTDTPGRTVDGINEAKLSRSLDIKNPFKLGQYLKAKAKHMDKFIKIAKETARRRQNVEDEEN